MTLTYYLSMVVTLLTSTHGKADFDLFIWLKCLIALKAILKSTVVRYCFKNSSIRYAVEDTFHYILLACFWTPHVLYVFAKTHTKCLGYGTITFPWRECDVWQICKSKGTCFFFSEYVQNSACYDVFIGFQGQSVVNFWPKLPQKPKCLNLTVLGVIAFTACREVARIITSHRLATRCTNHYETSWIGAERVQVEGTHDAAKGIKESIMKLLFRSDKYCGNIINCNILSE